MLVVDPGKMCGWCRWEGGEWLVGSNHIGDPFFDLLSDFTCYFGGGVDRLVAESYHLLGHSARQQAGSDMPSAQAIGAMRYASWAHDCPLYLVAPGAKRAGHKALDDAGRAAYARARNDHERDAVDLTGFVLRECRRKRP